MANGSGKSSLEALEPERRNEEGTQKERKREESVGRREEEGRSC